MSRNRRAYRPVKLEHKVYNRLKKLRQFMESKASDERIRSTQYPNWFQLKVTYSKLVDWLMDQAEVKP
jgi:hypothetical protein